MYVRVQSPQDPITFAEGAGIWSNAQNSNNIIYRNLTIVDLLSSKTITFLVRNVMKEQAEVDILFEIPDEFFRDGDVLLRLSPELEKRWPEERRRTPGLEPPDPRYQVAGKASEVRETFMERSREKGEREEPEVAIEPPPYRIRQKEVLLRGFRLAPGQAAPIRLTFRSDLREKAVFKVQVKQLVRGKPVGGIEFLVRTGHVKEP